MANQNRDLLVLFKADVYTDDLLQREVECLHRILFQVEHDDVFCLAHELVTRNKITSRSNQILKAIGRSKLNPFNFLLNKN